MRIWTPLQLLGILSLFLFPAPANAAVVDVDIVSFTFNPDPLTVNVGDTVRWTNLDAAPHWTMSDTMVWSSGTLTTGQQFSFTFTLAGTYPYHCHIHPSMTAAIIVQEPALSSDVPEISIGSGGAVNFFLDAGSSYAGRTYVLLGSLSGTTPGTPLPGGGNLPQNQDQAFNYIRNHLNNSMFINFQGTFDGSGQATATFDTLGPVPPVVSPGAIFNFAYTTISPFDFQSNAVEILFIS